MQPKANVLPCSCSQVLLPVLLLLLPLWLLPQLGMPT
jgi:hypothetical protein